MQFPKILLGSVLVVGAIAFASANQAYNNNQENRCQNGYNCNNNNYNNQNNRENNNYDQSVNNYRNNQSNNKVNTYSDKPYGPYHSYAVQPTTYGGRGLYSYQGYDRHAPSYSVGLKPANVLVLVPAGRPRYNNGQKQAPCRHNRRPRSYQARRGHRQGLSRGMRHQRYRPSHRRPRSNGYGTGMNKKQNRYNNNNNKSAHHYNKKPNSAGGY